MNNSDLENMLSKLSIKPPSSTYATDAKRLLQNRQSPPSRWQWNKALAAGLLLSLTINVWQYQSADQNVNHAEPSSTQTEEQQPVPGGYSVVMDNTSPDGHHQSYTVIWEHRS